MAFRFERGQEINRVPACDLMPRVLARNAKIERNRSIVVNGETHHRIRFPIRGFVVQRRDILQRDRMRATAQDADFADVPNAFRGRETESKTRQEIRHGQLKTILMPLAIRSQWLRLHIFVAASRCASRRPVVDRRLSQSANFRNDFDSAADSIHELG